MIKIDYTRDNLLTEYAKGILKERYMVAGEQSPQDAFARAATAFADDEDHAQRIYDYASKLWFMYATPVLSNGGTKRGLPISCFLNEVDDSRGGINEHISENTWLATMGGGIGGNWSNLRSDGVATSQGSRSTGMLPFMHIVDSQMLAVNQGNCYITGTEVLTSLGWVDFRDLKLDDEVAQVDTNTLNITYTHPKEIIEEDYEGEIYHISGGNNGKLVDLHVTPNHTMLIERLSKTKEGKRWKGKLEKVHAEDVNYHRDNRHYTCAISSGPLTELLAHDRLRIALQADGGLPNGSKIIFHFKKERKIVRLTKLLTECSIPFKIRATNQGTVVISFDKSALLFPTKDFEWVDLPAVSPQWVTNFVEELRHWDGSKLEGKGITFTTVDKITADKLQAILCVGNKRHSMTKVIREGNRQPQYRFYIYQDTKRVSGDSITKTSYAYKGKIHCCEVDTGVLIVRYNNIPAVCGNTRRGGYAAYLNISHPEILEFINMRKPTGGDINRKNMNLHQGINIPDSFMEVIQRCMGDKDADDSWQLIDPHTKQVVETVSAISLWQNILTTRYETGEPYLHFIDTSNKERPIAYKDANLLITQSNLCSEILIPTSPDTTAVCCLSSVNLEKYDEWKDTSMVEDLIRFLDNVLEYFIHNAPEGMEKAIRGAIRGRDIGLGAMGFHAYLQSKGIPFESAMASSRNRVIFKNIKDRAKKASYDLSVERGSCPIIQANRLTVPAQRNVQLLSIAPNASSSIICGGTSPSVEPFSANMYTEKTQNGSNIKRNKFLDLTEEQWGEVSNANGSVQGLDIDPSIKEVFKTSFEIDQHWIIEHAAARQPYICQSQSINLFFPPDCPVTYLHSVHFKAWQKGLKTLYYCRSAVSNRADNINIKFDRFDYKPNDNECLSCEG